MNTVSKFFVFVCVLTIMPLQGMLRWQQQRMSKIRSGCTTSCVNTQNTPMMLPFVARSMTDTQCKKVIHNFFVLTDGARELAFLKGCKNQTEMSNYSIKLRQQALGDIDSTPQCAIGKYFCQLTRPKTKDDGADAPKDIPYISQGNLALCSFLFNAAKKHEDNVHESNRNLRALFEHSKAVRQKLPVDTKCYIYQFLSPYTPGASKTIFPYLERAIDADNADIVTRCINSGCNLAGLDDKDRTPFERALVRGKLNSVKAFIKYGIPGLSKNFDHYLKLAQQSGNDPLVKYLQAYRDDVLKKQNEDFATASIEGYRNCNMLHLLRAGVDVNQKEKFFQSSPLYWSLTKKRAIHSQCLLHYGADPNGKFEIQYKDGSRGGDPLLRLTVEGKDAALTRLLLDAKADTNVTYGVEREGAKDQYPILALCAAVHDNVEVLKLLLDKKAEPNNSFEFRYKDGSKAKFNPIVTAVQHGAVACVKVLLDAKADINSEQTSLYADGLMKKFSLPSLAIQNNNSASLKLLLDAKADINSMVECRHKDGSTTKNLSLLEEAVQKGTAAVVKVLLDAKADANGTFEGYFESGEKVKETLTIIPIGKKNAEVLQLLLNAKANPNSTYYVQLNEAIIAKYPILRLAIDENDEASVKALLDAKADQNATCYDQCKDKSLVRKCPLLEVAQARDNKAIIKLLLDAKADSAGH